MKTVGGRWRVSLTQAVAILVNAVWSPHLVIAASGGEICIRVMLVSRFIHGLLSLGHIYRTNIRGRATLVFIGNMTEKYQQLQVLISAFSCPHAKLYCLSTSVILAHQANDYIH